MTLILFFKVIMFMIFTTQKALLLVWFFLCCCISVIISKYVNNLLFTPLKIKKIIKYLYLSLFSSYSVFWMFTKTTYKIYLQGTRRRSSHKLRQLLSFRGLVVSLQRKLYTIKKQEKIWKYLEVRIGWLYFKQNKYIST